MASVRHHRKRKRFYVERALAVGDAARIRSLIASDEMAQRHCFYLLVQAAATGNIHTISTLMAAGIDHTQRNHQPFRAAFLTGHLPAVKMLFGTGFDFSPLPFDPIMAAIFDGRADMVEWVLQTGQLNPGELRPLYFAVEFAQNVLHEGRYGVPVENCVACIRLLLRHGLGQKTSPEKAKEIALKVAEFKPSEPDAALWLAEWMQRWGP